MDIFPPCNKKKTRKSAYLTQYATMVKCNNPLCRDCKNRNTNSLN